MLGCSNSTHALQACGAEKLILDRARVYDEKENEGLMARWARKFVWVGLEVGCIAKCKQADAFVADMSDEERDKHIVR